MTELIIKKTRAPRTTKKQMEIIANCLEANKYLLAAGSGEKDLVKQNEAWSELTASLNTCGMGPQKTVAQWKSVVSELKTNIKKKARKILITQNKTGGGEPIKIELNDFETRIYKLISATCVEGAPGVPEIGINIALNNSNTEVPTEINEQNETVDDAYEPTQPKESTLPQVQAIKNREKSFKKRKRPSSSSHLAGMVESQCEAQKIIAKSFDNLSNSILTLSDAIVSLSSAIQQKS